MEIQVNIANYKETNEQIETHATTYELQYSSLNDPTIRIIDSGTSHTILKHRKYFEYITPSSRTMTTIIGPNQIKEGKGRAHIILLDGTKIKIAVAIFAPSATQNLINFQDIQFELTTIN